MVGKACRDMYYPLLIVSSISLFVGSILTALKFLSNSSEAGKHHPSSSPSTPVHFLRRRKGRHVRNAPDLKSTRLLQLCQIHIQ